LLFPPAQFWLRENSEKNPKNSPNLFLSWTYDFVLSFLWFCPWLWCLRYWSTFVFITFAKFFIFLWDLRILGPDFFPSVWTRAYKIETRVSRTPTPSLESPAYNHRHRTLRPESTKTPVEFQTLTSLLQANIFCGWFPVLSIPKIYTIFCNNDNEDGWQCEIWVGLGNPCITKDHNLFEAARVVTIGNAETDRTSFGIPLCWTECTQNTLIVPKMSMIATKRKCMVRKAMDN
jgi:hypothetical protein